MGRQEVEYAKKLREASDKMLADRAEAEAKGKPKPVTLEVEAKVRPDGNRPLAEGSSATLELAKLVLTVNREGKTYDLGVFINGEEIGFYGEQADELAKALKAKKGYVETSEGDVLKVMPSADDKNDVVISGGNVYLTLLAPELDKVLKFLTTQLKESTNEDGSEQNAVAEGQEETPAEGSEEASPEAGEEVTGEAKKKAPPFKKKDGDDKDKDDKDAKKKDKGGDKDKTKKCKACGEEIPADIEAGAKCPECGEIWDKKKEGPPKKDKKEDLELVRTRIRDRIKKVRAAYEAGERRRAAPDSSRRVEGDEREKAREERLERLAQRYPELVSRIRARREARSRRQDPRVAESDEIRRAVIADIRKFGRRSGA